LLRLLRSPSSSQAYFQIPFIFSILGPEQKVGVITADSKSLDESLLEAAGVKSGERLVVRGMEDRENFSKAVIEETGLLDSDKVKREAVSVASEMVENEQKIRALLLECSCLPPYASAIQKAVELPVFDYVTMINYVHSTLVRDSFEGQI